MHFLIITPSLNQLSLLEQAVKSVRDQAHDAITIHHHIQDGGSSDGTVEWLENQLRDEIGYTLTYKSEPDKGMYDAINRAVHGIVLNNGLEDKKKISKQEIFAWLNADEQYLPDALLHISSCCKKLSNSAVITGDTILVDTLGNFLAFRKGLKLKKPYIQASHLYNLSCATFYYGDLFNRIGLFNDQLKAAADEEFLLRALHAGFQATHIREYLSTFMIRNNNLGNSLIAQKEHRALKDKYALGRMKNIFINLLRITEKGLRGAYREKLPLEYDLYLSGNESRTKKYINRNAWKWPSHTEQ